MVKKTPHGVDPWSKQHVSEMNVEEKVIFFGSVIVASIVLCIGCAGVAFGVLTLFGVPFK